MKTLQVKWYYFIILLIVQSILSICIGLALQPEVLPQRVETVRIMSLDDMQYAKVLMHYGQTQSALAILSQQDAIDEGLYQALDKLSKDQKKALDLLIDLAQKIDAVEQESSWGWVKFEQINGDAKQIDQLLQLVFTSVNMGFSGWEQLRPALLKMQSKYPQESHTWQQFEALEQMGNAYV
ncbi:hypothetical protein OAT84_00300 [Gammaproteobacteria bacterium]|nr:hypothetical protein [Gammaproteobacteria bacterium]